MSLKSGKNAGKSKLSQKSKLKLDIDPRVKTDSDVPIIMGIIYVQRCSNFNSELSLQGF